MRGRLFLALVLSTLAAEGAPTAHSYVKKTPNREAALRRAIDEASCTGEYADEILALSNEAREFERRPEANYAYCVRNTAIYECLSYGPDGKVRRRKITVQAHGTAFSYKVKNGDYYLLTNDHVASWPLVTDDEHPVEDVPSGCKKVDEQLRIVRDESDDFVPGQIPVQRVVTDPLLDAAILKTHHQLNVMPYRVGRSALLKAGNIVQVRGYPLGVTAYDPDREKGWNHVDFVMDALVAKGNSGSPVFAISCRTGSLELVGLYHAGYRDSPALNAVVGIDQVHDLMENFRRSRPPTTDEAEVPGPQAHATIAAALQQSGTFPFFSVGTRVARAHVESGGHVVYEIFSDSFPGLDTVELTLDEVPDAFGGLQETITLNEDGGTLRRSSLASLDAEAQDVARSLFELTRRQLLLTLTYRASQSGSDRTRETYRRAQDLARQLDLHRARGQELLQSASEIASRVPMMVPPLSSDPRALAGTISDLAAAVVPPRTPSNGKAALESAPQPAGTGGQ
jgi:serine protease Do